MDQCCTKKERPQLSFAWFFVVLGVHIHTVFSQAIKLMIAAGSSHKLHMYRVLTAGGPCIQFARRDLWMAPCWTPSNFLPLGGKPLSENQQHAQVRVVRLQVQTKFALKRNPSKKPCLTLRNECILCASSVIGYGSSSRSFWFYRAGWFPVLLKIQWPLELMITWFKTRVKEEGSIFKKDLILSSHFIILKRK